MAVIQKWTNKGSRISMAFENAFAKPVLKEIR
jgi:hypothetical protein